MPSSRKRRWSVRWAVRWPGRRSRTESPFQLAGGLGWRLQGSNHNKRLFPGGPHWAYMWCRWGGNPKAQSQLCACVSVIYFLPLVLKFMMSSLLLLCTRTFPQEPKFSIFRRCCLFCIVSSRKVVAAIESVLLLFFFQFWQNFSKCNRSELSQQLVARGKEPLAEGYADHIRLRVVSHYPNNTALHIAWLPLINPGSPFMKIPCREIYSLML